MGRIKEKNKREGDEMNNINIIDELSLSLGKNKEELGRYLTMFFLEGNQEHTLKRFNEIEKRNVPEYKECNSLKARACNEILGRGQAISDYYPYEERQGVFERDYNAVAYWENIRFGDEVGMEAVNGVEASIYDISLGTRYSEEFREYREHLYSLSIEKYCAQFLVPILNDLLSAERKDFEFYVKNNLTHKERKRLFVDMDGTLAEFKPVDKIETLYEKGYFLNLRPQVEVVEAVNSIIAKENVEVYILSSVLSDSKYALQEKNEWLNQYLPEIPEERRLFPACGVDKKTIVTGGVGKKDFLLDDYTVNLIQWEPPGKGVKLLNGINHTKGTWKGKTVSMESKKLAEIIEKVMKQPTKKKYLSR